MLTLENQLLVAMASAGNLKEVVRLISEGADIHFQCHPSGQNALMWATIGGHESVVRWLLQHRAKVNAVNNYGFTALMWAEDVEIAKALIAAGADVNAKTNDGDTPLSLAEKNGNTEIAQILKEAGAKK